MVIPAPRQGLIAQEIDGETVLLNQGTNEVHTLNPTASYIWSRIERKESFSQILQGLVDQYDIDVNTATADLKRVITQLNNLGLFDETAVIDERR